LIALCLFIIIILRCLQSQRILAFELNFLTSSERVMMSDPSFVGLFASRFANLTKALERFKPSGPEKYSFKSFKPSSFFRHEQTGSND
jgi:hypothetical protein